LRRCTIRRRSLGIPSAHSPSNGLAPEKFRGRRSLVFQAGEHPPAQDAPVPHGRISRRPPPTSVSLDILSAPNRPLSDDADRLGESRLPGLSIGGDLSDVPA